MLLRVCHCENDAQEIEISHSQDLSLETFSHLWLSQKHATVVGRLL
ncbi:hypothetical protein GCM10008018_48760 [Paenibacillus marchantiophytorum]|uniref:Uncharacterized protein n=1 Tax=Paenibacillus marchantiophytorum TaxID=1619310 RepID=A0ABQ1F2J3_9BACL|nr:hypothetical protein GCM10008018_48760 [Paenibacillus marchantiophytorum]